MSAFFHPTLPLILSASLDDTVRVWDVSALFNEKGQSTALFALTDAVLKFQQEEHTTGVNWASWHPTRPLAVSCSDDQSIKIWKISETDLSVIATLRSHSKNVSCAVYHPVVDVVISASEDNTVRVWDARRFLHLAKHRRPDDRFWVVAAHPKSPLFAAGHDTGLIVFRLMRQRPAYDVFETDLIYYKDNAIHKYAINLQSDSVIGQSKPHPTAANRSSPLDPPPRSLAYSSHSGKFLVAFDREFELHVQDVRTIEGTEPVWITRNQFGWLSEGHLCTREVSGASISRQVLPRALHFFPAGIGRIFLALPDQIILWDVMRKQEIANRSIPHVRRSSLSADRDRVAFLSATSVTIATADLSQTSTHFDGARVKSGAWFKGQFFIYTTKTHLKYVLPNGDSGILRSIADRIYVAAVLENQVICLNEDSEVKRLEVDLTEARFKAALTSGKMGEVNELLRHAKLCSESIVDYLRKQNHPEVALLFVQDPELRFRLALSAADLDTALVAAKQLNTPAVWEALADVAIEQGRFGIAEEGLKKSGNVQRLVFFYLLSGQIESLKKLKVDDALGLQRAMWLGDRPAIAQLLAGVAPKLAEVSTEENASIAVLEYANDTVADWPLVNVSRPKFVIPSKSGEDDEGWDVDLEPVIGENVSEGEEDQGWDVDLEPGEIEVGEVFVAPTRKDGAHERWATADGAVAGELVAAGQFGGALRLLQQQIGLINAGPLREHFVYAFLASNATLVSCRCHFLGRRRSQEL
jgi:coatomer protein complex subunit alpha (xenin)